MTAKKCGDTSERGTDGQPDPAKTIKAALTTKINAIVCAATHEAERTCAMCGQPGRLYVDDYWQTLCGDHAEGRMFPPVYGQWLDALDNQSIGSGSRKMLTDRVMYFRGVALYSWRTNDVTSQDHVMVDEMPAWLLELAQTGHLAETAPVDKKAYLAEDVGCLVHARAVTLGDAMSLVLPAGCTIHSAQAFAYEAAKWMGMRRVSVDYLVEPKPISIAGGALLREKLQILTREDGEIDVAAYPDNFLRRRAEELEQMAATLREMLRVMEGGES